MKSGINLDDILPRADAVEEPARRLADIAVRGFDSPWVDYFKTEFPEIWDTLSSSGDPKAAAAGILRDFEDGLRPELLDKGRAKDLVRRALLGEQNTSALAAEIAGELATELGVSLAQAQQAAAGVLGTGGTTGEGTGMDGSAAAAAYTDSFVGSMTAMLARYEGTGGSAGTSFQVGFLAATSTMPAAILGNLSPLRVTRYGESGTAPHPIPLPSLSPHLARLWLSTGYGSPRFCRAHWLRVAAHAARHSASVTGKLRR